MESLGAPQLVFAACVITVAYAIRGTAGFGGQAVAVPLLALVLPLPLVLSSVVVLTALSSIGHFRRDRHHLAWSELRRLLPFSIAGVLIGLWLLDRLDVRVIVKAFGVCVIAFGVFALATASRPVRLPQRVLRPAGIMLSFTAGVLGATFGAAAGPLYVIYLGSCNLARDAFRVTITAILTVQAVVRMIGYARLGFFDVATALLIAAGIPLMIAGSAAGQWLATRLAPRQFNLAISVLMMVSGTALLFK